jgi:hypothetical protein
MRPTGRVRTPLYNGSFRDVGPLAGGGIAYPAPRDRPRLPTRHDKMASGPPQRSMLQPAQPLDAAELRRFGGWLAAGAIIGALIAVLLTFVWTPRWEASVQIRPGQIANGTSTQTLLESPARVAERLNSQAFSDALKERLGYPAGDDDPRSRLIDASLRATVLERAVLVVLKVEGLSMDEARRIAEAAVAQLSEAHAPMYRPTVERLTKQLGEIEDDVKRIESERLRLLDTMTDNRSAVRAADRFSESVLVGNLLNIRDSELRSLRDRAASINEQLSPERTYPTGPIDRVIVADRPSYPRRSIHAVGGVVLGSMVGGILALLIRRRR